MVRDSTAIFARDTPDSRPGPGADTGPDLVAETTSPSIMADGQLEKDRSQQGPAPPRSHSGPTAHAPPKWWKIHLFRGMINDVRRRAPYYWSDWTDALDYRVVPATIYMYFAKYETKTEAMFSFTPSDPHKQLTTPTASSQPWPSP